MTGTLLRARPAIANGDPNNTEARDLNAKTAKKHSLRVFAADTPIEKMIAALRRHGAVLIRGAVTPEMAETVAQELRPYFDSEGTRQQSDFDGYTTLRLSGVLAKSREAADLIAHPLVLQLADDILRKELRIAEIMGEIKDLLKDGV